MEVGCENRGINPIIGFPYGGVRYKWGMSGCADKCAFWKRPLARLVDGAGTPEVVNPARSRLALAPSGRGQTNKSVKSVKVMHNIRHPDDRPANQPSELRRLAVPLEQDLMELLG